MKPCSEYRLHKALTIVALTGISLSVLGCGNAESREEKSENYKVTVLPVNADQHQNQAVGKLYEQWRGLIRYRVRFLSVASCKRNLYLILNELRPSSV